MSQLAGSLFLQHMAVATLMPYCRKCEQAALDIRQVKL